MWHDMILRTEQSWVSVSVSVFQGRKQHCPSSRRRSLCGSAESHPPTPDILHTKWRRHRTPRVRMYMRHILAGTTNSHRDQLNTLRAVCAKHFIIVGRPSQTKTVYVEAHNTLRMCRVCICRPSGLKEKQPEEMYGMKRVRPPAAWKQRAVIICCVVFKLFFLNLHLHDYVFFGVICNF